MASQGVGEGEEEASQEEGWRGWAPVLRQLVVGLPGPRFRIANTSSTGRTSPKGRSEDAGGQHAGGGARQHLWGWGLYRGGGDQGGWGFRVVVVVVVACGEHLGVGLVWVKTGGPGTFGFRRARRGRESVRGSAMFSSRFGGGLLSSGSWGSSLFSSGFVGGFVGGWCRRRGVQLLQQSSVFFSLHTVLL